MLTTKQQTIVEDNYWIAVDVARRYHRKMCKDAGLGHGEKIAEAAVGLVKAAERYDPTKGKF